MAAVRALLALVFCLVGALIGYQLGLAYIGMTAVRQMLQNFPAARIPNLLGFTGLGLLLGLGMHQWMMRHIMHWSDNLKKMPADDKIAFIIGALLGIFFTFLLSPLITNLLKHPDAKGDLVDTAISLGPHFAIPLAPLIVAAAGIVLVFFGIQGMLSMKTELRRIITPGAGVPAPDPGPSMEHCKILDTNVIIDGRIADICKTGFLEGSVYVPGFVLDELQQIADSSDALKRARGRRGLDILNQMQKELNLVVRNYDHVVKTNGEPVDSKLVRLAKELQGTIVTNDYNLNKVAQLQDVRVLNVNELANAMKPVVLPGEELSVSIIKEGKEPNQGIAYLDDGTMVVVENAKRHIGSTVQVIVGSVYQTVAGKMVFGNLREDHEAEEEMMGRNLRSYTGPRSRRGRPH